MTAAGERGGAGGVGGGAGSAGVGSAGASAEDLDGFMADFDAAHRYVTRRLIKENAWERTELIEDESGRPFVRKYLKLDPGDTRAHPYERIAELDCPYLPRVVTTCRMGDALVVICEWVEGRDLQELYREYGPPAKDELVQVFDDVCEAASALHGAPGGAIVHRDINPSNVVFDGEHAHLIDLGIARAWHEGAGADTHLWGTAGYAAPEQYGFGQSDERADVYALGKLMRFLLTGRHPDEELEAGERPSFRQRQVIERACQVDPKDRYRDARALRRAADLVLRAPRGPIAWRPHLHPVLWYAWCALAWAVFALMVFGSALGIVNGTMGPDVLPKGIVIDLFVFFVPIVLLTGSFGVTERVEWFQENRRFRIGGAAVASFFLAVVILGYVF